MEFAHRLVVAADFDPRGHGGVSGACAAVIVLARQLRDTGVVIKINAILRAEGYRLISELHALGLGVFADLKLNDIPQTMIADAGMLGELKPEIVTVMCSAGAVGLRSVKEVLGAATTVLGVTVLTSMDEAQCRTVYKSRPRDAVIRLARLATAAKIDGLILSPQEVGAVRAVSKLIGLERVTPGIRPVWAQVAHDDQKRVATPAEAIRAGATRIVVGRPITQAADPRAAVQRTLDEIAAALEKRSS